MGVERTFWVCWVHTSSGKSVSINTSRYEEHPTAEAICSAVLARSVGRGGLSHRLTFSETGNGVWKGRSNEYGQFHVRDVEIAGVGVDQSK